MSEFCDSIALFGIITVQQPYQERPEIKIDYSICQLEFRYKDETRNFVPMKILSHFRQEFSVKEASVYLA